MKTTKLTLIATIIILSQSLNAQIKLLSTGRIALGSTTVPTGFNLSFNFNSINVGAGGTKPTIGYDLTPSDPRIWSSSGTIVLYNTSAGAYNDLEIRTLYENSDSRNKVNVTTLTEALGIVKKLRGVSYNWKKQVTKNDKKSYGLIAQEVEKVIPDVVLTDSLDNKMLNYNAIIPYLIESIKDLSAQVESLKNQSSSDSNTKSNTESEVIGSSIAKLYQNNPNPFSQSTEIQYYVPESASNAVLYVYDLQGAQVKSYPIQQRGSGSTTISGAELKAGMYIYALILDGKLIDSKRMVLTQ